MTLLAADAPKILWKKGKQQRFLFSGGRAAERTTVRTSAAVLPVGVGDNREGCFCGNLQPGWKPVCPNTASYDG